MKQQWLIKTLARLSSPAGLMERDWAGGKHSLNAKIYLPLFLKEKQRDSSWPFPTNMHDIDFTLVNSTK